MYATLLGTTVRRPYSRAASGTVRALLVVVAISTVGFVPSRIRLVDFTADRTLTLGDVPVTVPVRGFD
jgi:hypothetical protein